MYIIMEQNKVTSPCISVCKTDPISGFATAVEELMKRKIFGKMKILQMNGNKIIYLN